ncbi:MAG: Crp/Fnr family transcriptional regulator [Bacteroidota bacterium]
MDNTLILNYIRTEYPQLAEKSLQDEIASVGKVITFKSGDIILDIGSYINSMPLIISGLIKAVREDSEGNEIFLYYLAGGETCSMSFTCCLMNKKSEIRTIAEEDTLLIAIPSKYMDEWMSKYASWRNWVMKSYELRMKELLKTIDSIAFQKMDERLLAYLQNKAEKVHSKILHTTHQEIAYDLNASREAVSRLLKQLENDHYVVLGRNKIEILTK